jgi:hypothetical protein
MAIVKSNKSNQKISVSSDRKLIAVRVLDIILDLNHPKAIELGGYDSIGTIFYTKIEDNTPLESPESANVAKPLFTYLKYYPLVNEIVLILSTKDKNIYNGNFLSTYYLPQVNIWNHPHHNALPSLKGLGEENTSNDYQQTENGVVRKVDDGGTDITLGKYFNEQLNIKPLLPYEGDMIIEGRFGNSIRFGSTTLGDTIPDENKNRWSEGGQIGDPITIIRNGQSENLDEKGWVHTIENIDDDASSIYLTSNQQIAGFIPASLNQKSFGANLEQPQTIEQKLTDPTLNTVTEPELPEEEEQIETIQDEPVDTPPPIQEEQSQEEDELSPFDQLAEETEVGYYEVEKNTDNHAVSVSDTSFNINIESNDTTGDIETGIQIGDRGFILKHFLKSNTAESLNNTPGIDSSPTKDQIINNLKQLMENVGDKIFDQYPNMVITSGYRCKVLCEALGSSPNSEHAFGMAIDFKVPGVPTRNVFNWCVNNLSSWNQLIWEFPERESNSWIHISYQTTNSKRTTLASRRDKIHNLYGGERRGIYQDGITEAKQV